MKKGLTTTLSVLFLLALWQGIAMYVRQPELIPSVPVLLKTLGGMILSNEFYLSVSTTIGRGIAGMFLSLVAALILAVLFARVAWLYELFRPLLAVMRSVPVISFILLALIFLHTESIPLLIAFLTMFPLLTENLTKGLGNLQPGLSQVGRQFLVGRWNRWTQITYPQLKPFLYSGLSSAAGFGWRAVIMGEVLAVCAHGIGSEMKRAQSFIAVPELISWTVVAILLSYLSDKGIAWLSAQSFAIRYAAHDSIKLQAEECYEPDGGIQLAHAGYRFGITDYSYTFHAGWIYGISAPSGTGKTTLLQLIAGTLRPVQGHVSMDRSRGVSFVFQEASLLPGLNVVDNVALPLSRICSRENARMYALDMLRKVEMEALAARFPDELSYGQQQRVAIARALAFPAPFLLMDEPFKGIDEAVATQIIRYIRERQRATGQTVLFTSHQSGELEMLADEVIYLY